MTPSQTVENDMKRSPEEDDNDVLEEGEFILACTMTQNTQVLQRQKWFWFLGNVATELEFSHAVLQLMFVKAMLLFNLGDLNHFSSESE